MKRIFVVTALLMMVVTYTTAQNFTPPPAEERAKNQTERLNKLVKLNDDQKTKVQAINLDLAKKMDAAMKNRDDRDAMRTKMQEIETERDQKYKEILTEDQFKKYTDNKAEREKQMQERRRQRQG